MKRVSLGLVSLVLGLLLTAQALHLVPDRDGAVVEKRVAVCEALAIECSLAASKKLYVVGGGALKTVDLTAY